MSVEFCNWSRNWARLETRGISTGQVMHEGKIMKKSSGEPLKDLKYGGGRNSRSHL